MERISFTVTYGFNKFTPNSTIKVARKDRPIGIELSAIYGGFKTLVIEIRGNRDSVKVDVEHINQKGEIQTEGLEMPFGVRAHSELAGAMITALFTNDAVELIFTQE
jgi:hypothetical protein